MACICGQLLRIRQELDQLRCVCPACRRKFEVRFVRDPQTGRTVLHPNYLNDASVTGETFTAEMPGGTTLPSKRGVLDDALGPPPPPQIVFPCPQCGRKILAKRSAYDKRVRCPDCSSRMILTLIYDPATRTHTVLPVRVTDAPSGDTWMLDR
jgi:DNA-directed RNA polymerase subunit RPC12/RpoP